jgi:hypothetical protein
MTATTQLDTTTLLTTSSTMVHTTTSTLSSVSNLSTTTTAPTITATAAVPAPSTITKGDEVTLNSTTAGGQFFSTLATFADGSYIASWSDTSYTEVGEDAGGSQIRARVFNADGTPAGNDFQVNTSAADGQYRSQIAILGDTGNFVITWEDEGGHAGDAGGSATRAQMYNRAGQKIGGEFIAATRTTGDQEAPSITALPNGGYVITWQDGDGDGSGSSIRAQVFDSQGNPQNRDAAGNPVDIQVNSVTQNDQLLPSVTALLDGFVVVWEDQSGLNNDGSREGSIKAQRFDQFGHKVGGETLVDTANRAYVNTAPSVIGLSNGGYAVAWQAQSDSMNDPKVDGDDSNIQLHIFNADGTQSSAQIQVNQKGEEYQQAPKIVQTSNGLIAVVWEDVEDGDGDHGQIKVRFFNQQGQPVTDEQTVNEFPQGEQHSPSITPRPDGSVLISWTDDSASNGDDGIRARVVSVDGVASTISNERLISGGSVNENSAAGTVVGQVAVDVAAGDRLSFSLVNNPGNLFAIDDQGRITLSGNGPVDFETASSYGISVKVVDLTTGQSVKKDFTIKVNDVNEAPTIDTLSSSSVLGLPVAHDGVSVGTVHASDQDAGDRLTYSFGRNADGTLANGNGAFAINSATGEITVLDSTKLVFGMASVTVDVTDSHGLTVEKLFNINVQDPATQLVAANEQTSIAEDGSAVLHATDLLHDSLNASGATVTGVGGASHGKVSVTKDAMGNITDVNYVANANYSGDDTFTYTLSDAHGQTSTATVTVHVAPVADAPTLSVSRVPDPAAHVSMGDEVILNKTTVGGQFFSSVASFANGDYVATWSDTSYTEVGPDAGGSQIRARLFHADGTPAGNDFQVNTTAADGQYRSQIAILHDAMGRDTGNFVITWEDEGGGNPDAGGSAVRAQMYNHAGQKIGGEFVAPVKTTGDQEVPSITALANGGYVITWQDGGVDGGDGDGSSIKAQVFDANGHPLPADIQVNSEATGDQLLPSVTALADGGFVIVYEDDSGLNNDGARGGSIKAQKFDSVGHKVSEILVNAPDITYVNTAPSVIGLPDGGFAVTWQGQSDGTNNPLPGVDDDDSNVMLRIFDKDGKPGAQIQVNQKGEEYQQVPKIAYTDNGYIVVTWEDVEDLNVEPNGDPGQIKMRVFDPHGNPVTDEQAVNAFADGEQHSPSITALPGGRVLISWTDDPDTSGEDNIRARVITIGNEPGPAVVDIAANLTDVDFSESLNVAISGIPTGVTITDGFHTSRPGDTNVDVSDWNLHALTVVKSNGTGDVALTVTATSTEAGDPTHPASVSQTITLKDVGALPALAASAAPAKLGTTGNDVMTGGSGNDLLAGAGGNDTYQFSHGGGQDTIINGTATSTAPSGELDFAAGISKNQLWFERNGNDLTIDVMGSQDKITVAGWFGDAGAQLAEITAGGMKIDAGVSQLVQTMASYSSTHAGFDPTTATQAPNDAGLQNAIAANWHA